MEKITAKKLCTIQKYLIAGFIQDGGAEEFEGILKPEMFGKYKKEAGFLMKHGNKMTPDFVDVTSKNYLEIMEGYSSSYIMEKMKYVKELYKGYVTNQLITGERDVEDMEEINKAYAKLDRLEKGDFEHIDFTRSINRGLDEIMNSSEDLSMSWGWQEFDEKVGYLMGGQIIAIGAKTGIGKSTFVNQVCCNVSKQGFKVVRYSLEDRMEDKRKEELYYMVGRIRARTGLKNYPWSKFEINAVKSDTFMKELTEAATILSEENKNIIDLDAQKRVKIDDLVKLVEIAVKDGCKLFVIDHLHYFDMGGLERHDLIIEKVMHQINELARKYNITILLVAHYRKTNDRPCNDDFKDGASIAQVVNKIIHIHRNMETGKTEFIISKMRSPLGLSTIEGFFDQGTYQYLFDKSDLQKAREQK